MKYNVARGCDLGYIAFLGLMQKTDISRKFIGLNHNKKPGEQTSLFRWVSPGFIQQKKLIFPCQLPNYHQFFPHREKQLKLHRKFFPN